MPTKFTWEPSTGGSLLLRIKEGNRETTWTLKKNASMASVRQMLWEMESLIDEYNPRYERIPGVNAEPTPAEWIGSGIYDEPPEHNDTTTEEQSRQALSDRANSFKLNTGKWWDDNDMDDLDLYTLGTGDPE